MTDVVTIASGGAEFDVNRESMRFDANVRKLFLETIRAVCREQSDSLDYTAMLLFTSER